MSRRIHGLVPVLATPFSPDGALDPAGLRRLVEFELASGVDGVALFGMASEGFALTRAERVRIIGDVTTVLDGAVPVVAGVNGTSTVTALEQVSEAATGGAAAVMVLPPFLVKPGPDQVVEFYAEVAAYAAEHDLDVMVQDAPVNTGVNLPVDLLVELAKIDGVRSVKVEAAPTVPKVGAYVAALSTTGQRDVDVLGGLNAQFVLDEYAGGAVGTMPACEFPDLLGPVLADWAAGRRRDARERFAQLLPLINFGMQAGIAWAVHKEILVRRGIIDHATVRLPARPLPSRLTARIDEIFDDLFG